MDLLYYPTKDSILEVSAYIKEVIPLKHDKRKRQLTLKM